MRVALSEGVELQVLTTDSDLVLGDGRANAFGFDPGDDRSTLGRGHVASERLHLLGRLSQVSTLVSRERSRAATVASSDLESVGSALVKAGLSVRAVLGLDESSERAIRSESSIPVEVVVNDISASSLLDIEQLGPSDLQSRGITSLGDLRLGHLAGCSENTHNLASSALDRPLAGTNGVSSTDSGVNNSVDGEGVGCSHEGGEGNEAAGGFNALAFLGQVDAVPLLNEILGGFLVDSNGVSHLECEFSDSSASVVRQLPGSSSITAFSFEVQSNLSGSDSHVDLEFLGEITRSAVGADGSELEPVDVSSLKVVELEASGFSASDLSGASNLSRVLDAVGFLGDFLSVPEFETGVREGVPLKHDLLANSRLNSRSVEGSRGSGQLDSAGLNGTRKTASVLVASLRSDSDVASSSEVEGSSLQRSHRDIAGLNRFGEAGLFEVNLTAVLSVQVAECLPSALGVHHFEVVASDT